MVVVEKDELSIDLCDILRVDKVVSVVTKVSFLEMKFL
jgi:hypothetical protein